MPAADPAAPTRPILRVGDPRLRRVADAVDDPAAPATGRILTEMRASMQAAGGIGLAAPQIGINQRLLIYGVPTGDDAARGSVRWGVLINPRLDIVDATVQLGIEGCLSVPGLRGIVPRPRAIRYHGFDEAGQPVAGIAEGFHARVLLHEADHLDGILYIDRVPDRRWLGAVEEMAEHGAYWLQQAAQTLTAETQDGTPEKN